MRGHHSFDDNGGGGRGGSGSPGNEDRFKTCLEATVNRIS